MRAHLHKRQSQLIGRSTESRSLGTDRRQMLRKCFSCYCLTQLKTKTKQIKMQILDCHLPPSSGDHTQLPTATRDHSDSVSPDTTPTEAAVVILLEISLSNHPPRRAHSCNFCVVSSCLFSTSILIPAHGITHIGMPLQSFCSQHWGCCPQNLFYTGCGHRQGTQNNQVALEGPPLRSLTVLPS